MITSQSSEPETLWYWLAINKHGSFHESASWMLMNLTPGALNNTLFWPSPTLDWPDLQSSVEIWFASNFCGLRASWTRRGHSVPKREYRRWTIHAELPNVASVLVRAGSAGNKPISVLLFLVTRRVRGFQNAIFSPSPCYIMTVVLSSFTSFSLSPTKDVQPVYGYHADLRLSSWWSSFICNTETRRLTAAKFSASRVSVSCVRSRARACVCVRARIIMWLIRLIQMF